MSRCAAQPGRLLMRQPRCPTLSASNGANRYASQRLLSPYTPDCKGVVSNQPRAPYLRKSNDCDLSDMFAILTTMDKEPIPICTDATALQDLLRAPGGQQWVDASDNFRAWLSENPEFGCSLFSSILAIDSVLPLPDELLFVATNNIDALAERRPDLALPIWRRMISSTDVLVSHDAQSTLSDFVRSSKLSPDANIQQALPELQQLLRRSEQDY